MGMTLNQFYDNLEIDLKSTSEWSDPEKKRCVERAVADLSRFMPLEKVYETTLSHTVTGESVTSPTTSSATAIVNAKDISTSVSGNTCTLATKVLDVARNIKLTITDANASITSFAVIVKGIDESGYYQEESLYFKDGIVQYGSKLFKYISEVEIDEITGNGAADTLSLGTGLHTGVWQPLAYKPLKPLSETVINGTTTYTRDTDYEMDYINGRMRLLAAGSMAANTAYTLAYTKSRLGVDIASILPNISRISSVEYPSRNIPQTFVSYSIFGNFLYLGSPKTNQSQEENTNKEHVTIYYEMPQQPPSTVSGGSYPELLDEAISIGAGGYALLMQAIKYELQAGTDLTALGTALTNVKKYLDNNAAVDEAGILALITTDAANLRTLINSSIAAATTLLTSGLTVPSAPSLGSEPTITAPTAVAFTDATTQLTTGDDKIDTLNTGKDVALAYAEYSSKYQNMEAIKAQLEAVKVNSNALLVNNYQSTVGAKSNIYSSDANIFNVQVNRALGHVQTAQARLANLQTYLQQSQGYDQVAGRFIQEAQFRAEQVNGDIVLADRFKADGLERLNEFYAILKSKAEWKRKISSVALQQPR